MPSPFDPAAVAPETAQFNHRLADLLSTVPPVHLVPPQVTRAARAAGRGLFAPAGPRPGSVWLDLPGVPGGQVRLSPGAARGTYLHFHGGGWTLNAPDQYDDYNQRIAAATGLDVVSVRYRLAPEHRWPAQGHDCLAAALWVLAQSRGPVVLGGESAGAHLAMVTLLGLVARHHRARIIGAVFNYGIFDLGLTPSARAWGDEYLVLSTPAIAWFVRNLAPDPAQWADPGLSPIWEELDGLPPALFQVGTRDPLVDDTLFMAARWQAAGNATELAIYPGGVHAFDCFDIDLARQCHARQDAFLRDCLAG